MDDTPRRNDYGVFGMSPQWGRTKEAAMADENDQNDQDSQDERFEVPDDVADQLLAADQPERPATGDTDTADEVAKWKRLSRKNEDEKKALAEKLRKYEDANKSESQRLQEERDSHKTRAEKAEAALKRREIAETLAPDHATTAHIKAVAKRMSGDNDDDLEADAKELFEFIAPEPKTPKTPQRPKERLRGGGDPDEEPEETDPRKLAALIPRRR